MKKLFTLVVLILLFSFLTVITFAQDTSLTKYEDKFDKSISYSTKPQNYIDSKKTAMGWYFGATKTCYIFRIGAVEDKTGSQCIEKNASITFLFLDNSKLELKNSSEFSCKDPLYFIMFYSTGLGHGIYIKQLEQLKTKKIQTIRFRYYDNNIFDIEIPDDVSSQIMKDANIITTAKF